MAIQKQMSQKGNWRIIMPCIRAAQVDAEAPSRLYHLEEEYLY